MQAQHPLILVLLPHKVYAVEGGHLFTIEAGQVLVAGSIENGEARTLYGTFRGDSFRVLDGEQLITYAHTSDSTVRFRQYAKDAVPPWACDLRLDTEQA